MAKQFDVALKTLVHAHTADWLAFAGLPVGSSTRVIEADLSTISSAADKVIRVEGDQPYIAHLEFQSGQDADLDGRMLLYNVLLRTKYALPVRNPNAAEVKDTWTATFVLLGLRYPRAVGQMLLSGVRNMKESTTYQAILAEGEAEGKIKGEAEGRIKEAKSLLLRVGTRRFGYPPTQIALQIDSIADLAKLEMLHERIVDAPSWEALLANAS